LRWQFAVVALDHLSTGALLPSSDGVVVTLYPWSRNMNWGFGIAFFFGWMLVLVVEHHRDVARQKRLRKRNE
jgi:hypothetical protein